MKFLCLAYGDEAGWNSLTPAQQAEALDQDAVIRRTGNLMSAVKPEVTTVRNWDEALQVSDGPAVQAGLPLAGFSVIEADSVQEVVDLVSGTPCARAKGYIEIRPFWDLSGEIDA